MPIRFFKNNIIKTGEWSHEFLFNSSGTTGQELSCHAIPSIQLYHKNCQYIFEYFFGKLNQYHFFCLLPSYLERKNSSLVSMASHFIKESGSKLSGFYLNNLETLVKRLVQLKGHKKVMLLGVTFALLDLAEQFSVDLSDCSVIETGGMKGRRNEITRQELSEIIANKLNIKNIYSEYGMTECLSQAYSLEAGLFQCPPYMKVLIKEANDPFSHKTTEVGVINIIDLANTHSCAFIETEDIGKSTHSGYFEVLGRLDNADLRGCNLLISR